MSINPEILPKELFQLTIDPYRPGQSNPFVNNNLDSDGFEFTLFDNAFSTTNFGPLSYYIATPDNDGAPNSPNLGAGNDSLSLRDALVAIGSRNQTSQTDPSSLFGLPVFANIHGGDGDDTLTGAFQADTLSGDDGDDVLNGLAGDDSLSGGAGEDLIKGGDGVDFIDGGRDNDALLGENGDDDVAGGAGDDSVFGGEGDDNVFGGAGNDVVDGGNGDDHVFGDAGNDTMTGGAGDDGMDGGAGADSMSGGLGNDTMVGGAGNDTMNGDEGRDVLVGGLGNDVLNGGAGADTVVGDEGNDRLTGGAGRDLFLFQNTDLGYDEFTTTGNDRITDFNLLQDRIDLTHVENLDILRVVDIGRNNAIRFELLDIVAFLGVNDDGLDVIDAETIGMIDVFASNRNVDLFRALTSDSSINSEGTATVQVNEFTIVDFPFQQDFEFVIV